MGVKHGFLKPVLPGFEVRPGMKVAVMEKYGRKVTEYLVGDVIGDGDTIYRCPCICSEFIRRVVAYRESYE